MRRGASDGGTLLQSFSALCMQASNPWVVAGVSCDSHVTHTPVSLLTFLGGSPFSTGRENALESWCRGVLLWYIPPWGRRAGQSHASLAVYMWQSAEPTLVL